MRRPKSTDKASADLKNLTPTEFLESVKAEIEEGRLAVTVPHYFAIFFSSRLLKLLKSVDSQIKRFTESVMMDELIHILLCSGELGFRLLYANDLGNALLLKKLIHEQNKYTLQELIEVVKIIKETVIRIGIWYNTLIRDHHKILFYIINKYLNNPDYERKLIESLGEHPKEDNIREILYKFDCRVLKNSELPKFIEKDYLRTNLFDLIVRQHVRRVLPAIRLSVDLIAYHFELPFMVLTIDNDKLQILEFYIPRWIEKRKDEEKLKDLIYFNFILSVIKEQFVTQRLSNSSFCLRKYNLKLEICEDNCNKCQYHEEIIVPLIKLLNKLRSNTYCEEA